MIYYKGKYFRYILKKENLTWTVFFIVINPVTAIRIWQIFLLGSAGSESSLMNKFSRRDPDPEGENLQIRPDRDLYPDPHHQLCFNKTGY